MSASYRFAMLAYPSEYRERHGSELVATANELTLDKWSGRQSRSLFAAGLRTRALATIDGHPRNIWGQAALTAMGLMEVFYLCTTLAYLVGIRGDLTTVSDPWVAVAMSTVFLGLFCLHFRSWLAALLVARVALAGYLAGSLDLGQGDLAIAIGTLLLALAMWLTARRSTAKRAFSLKTAGILVGASLAAAWLTDNAAGGPPLTLAVIVGVMLPGLVLFRLDPRPAATATMLCCLSIAFALPMAFIAPGDVESGLLLLIGVNLGLAAFFGLLARAGVTRLLHHAL